MYIRRDTFLNICPIKHAYVDFNFMFNLKYKS